MNVKQLPLVLVATMALNLVFAQPALKFYQWHVNCNQVKCPLVEECGPGHILELGGLDKCCMYCKRILGLNEYCPENFPDPFGFTSKTGVCDREAMLACSYKNVCRSVNEVLIKRRQKKVYSV